jgi:glyoxylase-like metal-dependent hydrolase (beta-lactamase superfamily II)
MNEVAENVFQISLFPRSAVNAYLIGSVLVDAGIRTSASLLQKAVGKHSLTAHVLTHAHADHQGASAFICEHYQVPLWCGQQEIIAAETGYVTGEYPNPKHPIAKFQQQCWAGSGQKVARVLHEGDVVEGFRVIETPGHASGHIALWRKSDGVLIAGDVLVNMDMKTTLVGLHEPPALFTNNRKVNIHSIHKLAKLEPQLLCLGHGPVLRDTAQLEELAALLPAVMNESVMGS